MALSGFGGWLGARYPRDMVPNRVQNTYTVLKLRGGRENAYYSAFLIECSHGANTIVELKKHCDHYYVATGNLKIKGYRIGIYCDRNRFKVIDHTGTTKTLRADLFSSGRDRSERNNSERNDTEFRRPFEPQPPDG